MVQVVFDERRDQLDCLFGLDGFASEEIENWLALLLLLELLVAVVLPSDSLVEFFELVEEDVVLMLSRRYVVLLSLLFLSRCWGEVVVNHVEEAARLGIIADEGGD